MMKFSFFLTCLISSPAIFICMLMLFLIYLILSSNLSAMIMIPELDFISLMLIILTLWLTVFMIMANFFSKSLNFMMLLFKLMLVALCLSFSTSSILSFYVFFEASLIPIFILILTLGYQPERFLASLMMFFYTLVSSFPLLASLLYIMLKGYSLSSMSIMLMFHESVSWLSISLVLAFLVKFPMYSVHLWLPKAHVEAPVSGSMILAGVMLKLGGYGLYRLSMFYFFNSVNFWFSMVSGVGGSILALLCCRMMDMKVLIAYSSVVHMSMIIISLLNLSSLGLNGVLWIMLAHGIVSSGMFAGANLIYERSHSRSMLINKGGLTFNPIFSFFWFIIIVMNFAGPFTLNLLGEIYLILSVISFSRVMISLVSVMSFFSAAYGIILYASTQQGNRGSLILNTHLFKSRDYLLMFSHIWPGVMILLMLNI